MGIRPYVKAPDWSESHHRGPAKCRGYVFDEKDDDLFFDDAQLAMGICNGAYDGVICPRRTECLKVAMLNHENFGVWGGMTAPERLRLRLRYPGMPERWTWRPEPLMPSVPSADGEGAEWPEAA